jgi:hypothetical protein
MRKGNWKTQLSHILPLSHIPEDNSYSSRYVHWLSGYLMRCAGA